MRIMFSRITYIYFINVQLSYDLFQSKLEHKYHTVSYYTKYTQSPYKYSNTI